MRRRRDEGEEEPEINITPMLDIVFIMLIFFIVTAVFVKEAGIDVTRPDALSAQEVKRVKMVIAVSDNNEIWINKREVPIRDVRAVVEKQQRENPQGSVVIQADSRSQTGIVVDIMDQLNAIGVPNVHVATEKND